MFGSTALFSALTPPWLRNPLWAAARAIPSLDLRFADNKSLVDSITGQNLITFTRASSGTFVNSEGLIQTATTDVPRFDHNPTTGESLGLLVEESRTNLLLQSNQFDTTWTNSNSSETAAAGTAPDGTNTAWELKDTADAVVTVHSLVQTTSTSFTSGVAYTFSCWMKAGTLTEGGLVFPGSAFTSAINCRINLSTGAVISSSPTVSASTVSYANGWYRVIATATATATSAGSVNIRPANGALSYIGTGTGTILVWGAQIEAGSFPTSYIPTTSATVTRSADVASITGTNFGTTRTNLFLQSNQFDTTWTNTNSSETAAAGTAPDGTNTAWELRDTVDAVTTSHVIQQTIAFTSGLTYTASIWAKAGTLPAVNSLGIVFPSSAFGASLISRFNLSTGIVSSAAAGSTNTITAYPNGWYRCTMSLPATATTSAGIGFRTGTNSATSYVGDGNGTILIWGAQIEVGSAVTPYIPTTSATASVFDSSWYRQDEGTVFVNAINPAISTTLYAASDGTTNNRIQADTGTNTRIARVVTGGTTQASNSIAYTFGAQQQFALSYVLNSINFANAGTLGTEDTSATIPTVDQLRIGANPTGANALNSTIKRLTYWPTRLANNVLQEVTR